MKKVKRVREKRKMINCEECDSRIDTWNIHCPDCGSFQLGEDEADTDCEGCGRGISYAFAYCPYCAEKTGETPSDEAPPYWDGCETDEECPECHYSVSSKMLYCTSCAHHLNHEEHYDDYCECCEQGADSSWEYCAWCGAKGLVQGSKIPA